MTRAEIAYIIEGYWHRWCRWLRNYTDPKG